MSDTSGSLDLDLRLSNEDGSHDLFSHYVRREDATRAYIEGSAIRALCGKYWVPSRDPQKYPLCPSCKEIHDGIFGPNDPNA